MTGMGTIGGMSAASVSVPQEMIDTIENVGFLASIPLWLVTLLGSLFITILSFILILTVYGRFFRLYMYTALAPLPLSSFGHQLCGKGFLEILHWRLHGRSDHCPGLFNFLRLCRL